ncbi:TLC domain-containing protein 3A [Lepisosteus oculatus]|uniref:TLC domain containing 3A n=1 Tax=Lepisosteus oculatus TaxID=7918 RepID=W5MIS9_LEPOC|nr:PREDICTED: protein FAM57A [Lepisosteus oculatus]
MLHVLLSGAFFFPGVFYLCRKVLPVCFKRWSDADVVLVSERLVSSVHAIMATTSGFIVVSSCDNVMTDRHWLATYFVWFAMSYMAYDLYAMYLSHWYRFRVKGHEEYKEHSFRTVNSFVRREFLLVLHHIVLLTILLPITLFFRRDLGDFFVGCLFTAELSTPFVSLGKILIQLGLQDCLLHKVNGVVVLLSFFLCRILLFPYMYWVYGRHYGLPLYSAPFHLPLSCNLGTLCIMAPQVYWFVLLCRKGLRLYQRQAGKRPAAVTDAAQ